jgi:NADH-quinone oxidoreductase subunit C
VARLSDVTEAPALPGDGIRERMVQQLRDALGEALLDSVIRPGDDVWVRVRTDAWAAAGKAARDVLGCHYFCFLSAIDWMPSPYGRGEDDPTEPAPERDTEIRAGAAGGDTRMQVFARVVNIDQHTGITLKTDVPDDHPAVATWTKVYAGASWHERETHEMFGIGFDGHNDLRNMYLPTGFEGHPMRKDYPLLARMVKPWPGIVDVEPLPGEADDAGDAGDADKGVGE